MTGTSGNVSLRLDAGQFLVTPAQRSLGALDIAEIVRIDAGGDVIGKGLPTSELPLHLAAYRARPDAACVVHAHPTFCVVWSRTGGVFPADTVGARETLGKVGWTPYRQPGSIELAELCAREFATGIDTLLMERHGISAIGGSLEAAFDRTDQAEEAARVAYYAALAGNALTSGRE